MFRNDRLCEKSGHDVDHRFVDWCSEVLSLVRWPSPSWYLGAWGDYIWTRGWSYYCLLDYKWNHNVQNEHPFLLKKTWNKLLWKQFTEVQIEWDVGSFILHRLPYIRLLFETKCVVSFWTCKLKTKLVHWLYFSDPAAICLYSLYLLHVIVTWPKFQFETFTWPLC